MIGGIQCSLSVLWRGILAVYFLSCMGCSGNQGVEVTGNVTSSGGTPIPRARVIYRSSEDSSFQARAVTNMEGRYELRRTEKETAIPPGKYDVLIAPVQTMGDSAIVFDLIPPKYSSFSTSGLQVEVTSEQTAYDFVLDVLPR